MPEQDSHGGSDDRARYEELLSEIRVMLPGVEVLFAFLLTSVFSSRFHLVDDAGQALYLVALIAAALTILLLTVPAFLHRLSAVSRETRVGLATNFQLIGSISLGVSVCSGLFVVVRFVFSQPTAVWATAGVALAWIVLWYVIPFAMGRSPNGRS